MCIYILGNIDFFTIIIGSLIIFINYCYYRIAFASVRHNHFYNINILYLFFHIRNECVNRQWNTNETIENKYE